jgi:predicted transcriptional regulator
MIKVVFKPSVPGLAKVLTSAEAPILEVLWQHGPLTGREIYERVRQPKELAYATVLTPLGRMVTKRSVRRRKADGVFTFEAVMKKPEFEGRVAGAVMKGILEISPFQAVSTFVDAVSHWDRGKLDEVMEIIEHKRKSGRRSKRSC